MNEEVKVFFENRELVIDYGFGRILRLDEETTLKVIRACVERQREAESWGGY